jgi:hypothetical protein
MLRRYGYRQGPLSAGGPGMGARGAYAARSGLSTLAGLVLLAGAIVAAVLVIGILLVVLGANPHNELVSYVHDAARWLAGPFDGLFKLSHNRAEVALNWGIAALVYLAASRAIAGLLGR